MDFILHKLDSAANDWVVTMFSHSVTEIFIPELAGGSSFNLDQLPVWLEDLSAAMPSSLFVALTKAKMCHLYTNTSDRSGAWEARDQSDGVARALALSPHTLAVKGALTVIAKPSHHFCMSP